MAKHFISVLGTGLYEPVEYAFEGQSLGKYEFIQAAMIRKFHKELKDNGKISIFLTEGATKKNWEKRTYNEEDQKTAQKWKSDEKDMIIPGNTKQGLKQYLESEFGSALEVEAVPIENATTESQIWSVFQTIYENIEDEDEIIFDITHSFRSIPMLAIIIINFARVMKNCEICGIYYGAYEAKDEDGVAPIVDLTIYNDIFQWTSATDTFMRYGNADQINQLYKSKKAFLYKYKKESIQTKEWNELGKIITAISNLSHTLATCRGIDAEKINCNKKEKTKISIRCAYQKLKQEIEKDYPESVKEIVPLYQLLNKAKENYSPFDKEDDYIIGCEVVRWSIANNMTQQGYTALEETIKTYLCDMYGLDNRYEKERDKIISNMLNAFFHFKKKTKKLITEENQYTSESRAAIRDYIIKEDRFTSKLYLNTENGKDVLKIYDKIIYSLPIKLAIIANQIKEKRNDINHFGFNPNPSSAEDLQKTLKENFEKFEKFLQEDSEQFKARIESYQSAEQP